MNDFASFDDAVINSSTSLFNASLDHAAIISSTSLFNASLDNAVIISSTSLFNLYIKSPMEYCNVDERTDILNICEHQEI